jgi:hypothetical protein
MNTYQVIDLGGLSGVPNGTCSPTAISSVGRRITGSTELPGAGRVPFLWADFKMQPVQYPGTPSSTNTASGSATNSRGDVAGQFPASPGQAFLTRNGGTPLNLHDMLNAGVASAVHDMNESGDVVGEMSPVGETSDNPRLGWVYANNSAINLTETVNPQILGALGINSSQQIVGQLVSGQVYVCNANGTGFTTLPVTSKTGESGSPGPFINDNGQIAGNALDGSHYLFQNGHSLLFDGLGGPKFKIAGINNKGQVVASDGSDIFISDPTGLSQAETPAIYSVNGLLGNAGWVVTDASGVDDSGAIIGVGTNGNGPRGVLLTPTVSPPRFHQASFVKILFGILADGPGVILPGGPVPPVWGPNLTHGQRDAVLGLAINAAAGMITDRAARSEMQKLAAALVRDAGGRLNESE